MKIINPIPITDDMFIDSTVAENDHPEWDSAVAYAFGNKVMRVENHKVYEALTDNTNKFPPDSPTDWMDVGSTNRWGMFDGVAGTQTTAPLSLITNVTIPDPINSIALFGVHADELRVEIFDGITKIYDKVEDLTIPPIEPLEPVQRRSDFALFRLPSAPAARIKLTFTIAEGDVTCGLVAFGIQLTIATTSYGSGFGIVDFSRKEADMFGRPILVKRRFSKKAQLSMTLLTEQIDRTQKLLADYRATPIVWVASDQFQSSVIYGFYRDFNISVGPTVSQCGLELEGLI